MYVRRATVFLLYFFLAAFTGHTQQFQMTYYTVSEGLPSNTIRKIFQDRRGNIWVGTLEGISKYDGRRFINYSKANGLPHSWVNDMLETATGTLVFACNDGSLAWIQHDRVINVTHPGAVINQFCTLKSGKVLAATDAHGIQEFDGGRLYEPPQPFANSNYFSLAQLNDSLVLAGSDSSVQILTHDYRLVKRFGEPSRHYGDNRVFKDSRGRLWASHLPGLSQLSFEDIIQPQQLDIPELNGADIEQFYEDRKGNIWFAGKYGLVQLSPEGKLSVIRKKNGLLSDAVICVFQDREDNLWIGTPLGLCKMPAASIASYEQTDKLVHPPVIFVQENAPDQLIVSTHRGWQFFDENKGEFSGLLATGTIQYAVDKGKFFHPPIFTNAWQPISKKTKTARDIEKFFQRLKPNNYQVAYAPDCVFIAIGARFYIYEGNEVLEDTTIWIGHKRTYRISGLVADGRGTLWVGTWEEGLFRLEYNINGGQVHFIKKELVMPGIPIRSLMLDNEGDLWIGTRFDGLYRLRQMPGRHYETENWNTETGLASNWIYAMFQDPQSNIWLLYQDGLDKMVRIDKTFRPFNFSRANGFPMHVHYMFFRDSGSLWLGTSNGLVHMQDGEMEKKPPWPVTITAVNIGDSSYHPEIMPASLSYRRNSLRIDFSASTLINEKQVLYSYRLTGSSDTAWSAPRNLHSISFASLRPGDYRFEVRSLGWNGQWGDPAAIHFTILPPLWQRGWFVVVFTLLAAALIALMVRRRIRQIRHEAEMKQQLAETEMMALRAQMNPHFLFNSLNAIDSLIQTSQHDKATTYLGRFARLLRLVLDSSKNKLVSFDQDIAAMQLYLDMEKFRCAGKFQFDITAEQELINGGYSIPPLLAQPFIENAIYHGLMNKQTEDRRLTVKASLQDEFIVFSITDNGVGLARAKEINALNRPEHVSYGWQITTQRLGLHNRGRGEDYVIVRDISQGKESCGTSVTLKIKINPS